MNKLSFAYLFTRAAVAFFTWALVAGALLDRVSSVFLLFAIVVILSWVSFSCRAGDRMPRIQHLAWWSGEVLIPAIFSCILFSLLRAEVSVQAVLNTLFVGLVVSIVGGGVAWIGYAFVK